MVIHLSVYFSAVMVLVVLQEGHRQG